MRIKIKKIAKKILNPLPEKFQPEILLQNIHKIEIKQKKHPKNFIQTWDFINNDLANLRFHNDSLQFKRVQDKSVNLQINLYDKKNNVLNVINPQNMTSKQILNEVLKSDKIKSQLNSQYQSLSLLLVSTVQSSQQLSKKSQYYFTILQQVFYGIKNAQTLPSKKHWLYEIFFIILPNICVVIIRKNLIKKYYKDFSILFC